MLFHSLCQMTICRPQIFCQLLQKRRRLPSRGHVNIWQPSTDNLSVIGIDLNALILQRREATLTTVIDTFYTLFSRACKACGTPLSIKTTKYYLDAYTESVKFRLWLLPKHIRSEIKVSRSYSKVSVR